MGRSTDADNKPLLNDADQNIGNSATVNPQSGDVGTVTPQILKDRILNLQGGSAAGQTTTIVMTASRIVGADNPNPGFPGPITGIIEYGNGGRSTRIEFDIPVGPFAGSINQASSAVEPQDGAVVVTVPTSVLRAYARYDNLLLAPLIGSDPPISHAQLSGVPVIGPGGPLLCANSSPPPVNITIPSEPILVKAMASYFSKAHSKVYKTLNCYIATETNNPAPSTITVGDPSISQIAVYPKYAFWALPALTKRIKILRFPDSSPLDVLLHNGIRPVDYINIAANVTAPVIEVVGGENIIGITSTINNTKYPVSMLQIVCELGI